MSINYKFKPTANAHNNSISIHSSIYSMLLVRPKKNMFYWFFEKQKTTIIIQTFKTLMGTL